MASRRGSEETARLLNTNASESTKFTRPVRPLIGRAVIFSTLALITFSVLLGLRLDQLINLAYWWIFLPLGVLLLFLLVLTQSRTLSARVPLIARLAWLISVLCLISFLVLLAMHYEFVDFKYRPTPETVLLPLWIFMAIWFLLGTIGVMIGLCSRREESRQKYLLAGLPCLLFDCIFFPFILMVYLKTSVGVNISWEVTFVPFWIADGFFLILGVILCLFTIGGSSDATFNLFQVLNFLCVLVLVLVFQVLVVVRLNGTSIEWLLVFCPLILVELLFLCCGCSFHLQKEEAKVLPTELKP